MSRRDFLREAAKVAAFAGGAGLWAAARAPAATPEAAKATKLNFVFILIDDLGWTDVACYGSRFYETPNVDRLARMGMRFTNGYAACTVCSPTRVSILTGKYPARVHLTDWISGHKRPYAKLKVPDWTMYMRKEEVTLAEALKPAGYATGFIGKWHLGPGEEYWPKSQGFDVNIGGCSRGSPPSYFAPYRIPTMEEGPQGEYLTDRHAADAEKFLDAHRDEPFLLYLSTYAVHTPLQSKAELAAKYKAKAAADPGYPQSHPVYGGMVHSMDECVGRVIRKLEQLKLLGRTVILFTGDNGGLIGNPRRPVTSNVPLRAGKGSSYEGGVREPFIICWPGVTRPGSVCHEPVMSIDFYPTILQMAGVTGEAKHNRSVDGVSLVPLLKGAEKLDRDAIYWHYPHYHPGGATPYGAIRQRDFKLIEFYEDMHVELYNLREDIGEKHDLSEKMPDKAAELRQKLHRWRQAIAAQMPTPNPKYDPEGRKSRDAGRRKKAPRQAAKPKGK
jgi:arylsulfatase A-like enzyme